MIFLEHFTLNKFNAVSWKAWQSQRKDCRELKSILVAWLIPGFLLLLFQILFYF